MGIGDLIVKNIAAQQDYVRFLRMYSVQQFHLSFTVVAGVEIRHQPNPHR